MTNYSWSFYKNDYKNACGLLNEFILHIEKAIANVEMIKYEPLSIPDVLLGFSDMLKKSLDFSESIGRILSPALLKFADVGLAVSKMMQNSIQNQLSGIIEAGRAAAQISPALPDFSEAAKLIEKANFPTASFSEALRNQKNFYSSIAEKMDYSKYLLSPIIETIERQQRLVESFGPKYPVLDAIQKQIDMQNYLSSKLDPSLFIPDVEICKDESNYENINEDINTEEEITDEQ